MNAFTLMDIIVSTKMVMGTIVDERFHIMRSRCLKRELVSRPRLKLEILTLNARH